MWNSLLSTFQIEGLITYPTYASGELQRYEREIGFALPQSYKNFCCAFGPGELVSPFSYEISAPGPENWASPYSIRSMHQSCREYSERCFHSFKDPLDGERLQNAHFFSKDISAYYYFWNTAELTCKSTNEYAIYVIKRTCKIFRLCDTFSEFVSRICLIEGIPGDDPNTERERIFVPDSTDLI